MSTQDTHSHLHLVRRYSGRIPLEEIPWFEDLKEVAKLYRWLDFLGEAPVDPARFIEDAFAYAQQYDDMLCWTGRHPEHPKPGETS